jgi:hypothetical protein
VRPPLRIDRIHVPEVGDLLAQAGKAFWNIGHSYSIRLKLCSVLISSRGSKMYTLDAAHSGLTAEGKAALVTAAEGPVRCYNKTCSAVRCVVAQNIAARTELSMATPVLPDALWI